MEQYISNSLEKVFEPAVAQRVKYTANEGMVVISTANTNLNGTGTIGTVFTSGVANGTLIKTITIKATGNTTRGMVRLFLSDSGPTFTDCIAEIPIPETTISSVDKAFSIMLEVDFMLLNQWVLGVSTEKAESFVVIAECLDTAFP